MEKLKKAIIPILIVLCVLSVVAMILALNRDTEERAPFVPPNFDAAAQEGTPEVPQELKWSELYQDGMTYRVGLCGNIIEKDGLAEIYFTNSKDNNVWLKLRVLDQQNQIVGETGLIKPNEYVKTLKFNKAITGDTKVKLKVMAYQPETYYSEGSIVLNTIIAKGS